MAGEPINPYAPPTSDGEVRSSGLGPGAFPQPLFSPRQALVATLIGSVLAGALLLQANYRVMGRSRAANTSLALGLFGTAALLAIAMVLPKEIPGVPINIAIAVGFFKLFESLQGDAIATHREAGGPRRSNWLVFGITIASVVAVLGILFGILFASGALDGLE